MAASIIGERCAVETTVKMSCGACSPQVHDDAFAVRRAVFMEEQGYENEFEPIDEDPSCIHVVLYAGKELAGCARVFPEELEHTLNPGMPQSPACSLDAGVQQGETYITATRPMM